MTVVEGLEADSHYRRNITYALTTLSSAIHTAFTHYIISH